ncbi:MAG: gliding motility-associated C-terminal domain-containing protein [Bacteroidota bacterium]|nr:gliding motility-associated C-terminal domain-containing protein [Bacteroidota bacterium]
MKFSSPYIFLATALFSLTAIHAQVIPSTHTIEYQQLKQSGEFPSGPLIINNRDTMMMNMQTKIQPSPSNPASVVCSCMIPIDATFSVVPMDFYTPPDYRNDDGSSILITIPFNFCFYGAPKTNCYINNNGNVSFDASYGTFTANAFPDPDFTMIAPFWGDVDTRNAMSGLVYYKVTPAYMIVRWQNVGYFNMYADKVNDFQLIITNGSDPILPSGNNVSFCYGDMQWTTGDASGGFNGFGGSAATVGVNRGNGVDYIQIGQFDQPGTSYDGPFGNPDQVSWLDNQTFYFDVCNNGSGNNLPPIINSAEVCDTLVLCIGDTTTISAAFLSPEQGQNTTPSITGSVTGLTTTNSTTGNPAVITATLIANAANAGYNVITITGTDNGSPSAQTTASVIVNIIASPAINFTMSPPPPVTLNTLIQFTDNTPGATSWYWDFGDGDTSTLPNPTHFYSSDSLYTVTLTVGVGSACNASLSQAYLVHTDYSIIAPNVLTPNGDGKNDELVFQNLLDYPNSELEVFNRWGNLIYTSNNYRNDWRPDVVDGTYYYVLIVPGLEKPLHGFFEVMR